MQKIMSIEGETPQQLIYSAVISLGTMIVYHSEHLLDSMLSVFNGTFALNATFYSYDYWLGLSEKLVSALILAAGVFFLNRILHYIWPKKKKE